MDKYWKTGELAKITGLSIRTLRYYDQIKLLSPSEYTNSGHRRYSHEDLQNLLEILTLKQMGFSLDDIRTLKQEGNNSTILDTLTNQIKKIKSDIEIQQKLLHQLESIHEEFSNSDKEFISLQNLTVLFELLKSNHRKYFSQAQIDLMRKHYQSIDENTLRKGKMEFNTLLNHLREKKGEGIPPTDREVIQIAIKWKKIIDSFSPNGNVVYHNAEKYYSDNPMIATKIGIEPDLYRYIQEALLN